jgi:hypothetical protein
MGCPPGIALGQLPSMTELNREIIESVANASRALELGSGARLGMAEIGVVLEEALVLNVVRHLGPLPQLRRRLANADETLRSTVISRMEAALCSLDADFVHELSSHPLLDIEAERLALMLAGPTTRSHLGLRLAQRAFERILGERVAPPLRIRWSMSDETVASELPGQFSHAIIFGELIGAAEEILPLVLDAYSVDLTSAGEVRLNVIGVHVGWLDEFARATRIIYYNHATREYCEASLAEPLAFESCQVLYLGRNESRLHEELTGRLSSRLQLNPNEVACCCDDKFRTVEILRREGLRTPKACLISASRGASTIRETLGAAGLLACSSIVVQPNRGTEGGGADVLSIDASDERTLQGVVKQIEKLWAEGANEVLVRERIECVRLIEGEVSRATCLRVNVFWDGQRGYAESGYVQVAGGDRTDIAAVSCGGSIVALSEGILDKLGVTHDELTHIRCTASAAVAAVNQEIAEASQFGLYGVDVLLERHKGGPLVWVLEINARPAGLSHSDFWETREPGVSTILFESLIIRLIGACDYGKVNKTKGPSKPA